MNVKKNVDKLWQDSCWDLSPSDLSPLSFEAFAFGEKDDVSKLLHITCAEPSSVKIAALGDLSYCSKRPEVQVTLIFRTDKHKYYMDLGINTWEDYALLASCKEYSKLMLAIYYNMRYGKAFSYNSARLLLPFYQEMVYVVLIYAQFLSE